jgi:hypothetical protein
MNKLRWKGEGGKRKKAHLFDGTTMRGARKGGMETEEICEEVKAAK